jgi:tetratricopeptide (TPR) repeat protein
MFGLSVTGSTFLLWVAFGVLLTPTARNVAVKAADGSLARTVAAALVAAVIVAGFVGNSVYYAADRYYLLARAGFGVVGERIENAETAIRLNPYNDMYRTELGLAYQDATVRAITEYQQMAGAGQDGTAKLVEAENAFNLAEQAMLSTIDFVPYEYDNYVFLANLYSLGATYFDPTYFEDAVRIAEEGVKVEPYGPAIRLQMARALLGLGRADEAVEQLEIGAAMDTDFFEIRLLLGEAYTQAGDLESAKATYEEALALQPNNEQVVNSIDNIDRMMDEQ